MRVLALLLLLWAAPSVAEERAKTVLLFVPEDVTVPATADFTRNFRQVMQSEWRESVTVNVEHLEMAWFGSAGYKRALRDFYVAKYRDRRPDALVVFADATPFALELQQELWPQVPLLSVQNDDFLAEALPASPYVRGNWADFDVPATVRTALRLLPDTRHVVLVLGSSQRELEAWDFVEQEIRSAAPDRGFIGLPGLTLEELRRWMRELPADSVVFLIGFMRDAQGRNLSAYDVLRILHADGGSPPIFSVHRTMLGSGIVGGMLLDYQELGRQVARRTFRLLEGERASSLPPGPFEVNQLAFDARELQRWNIPESRLPPGSVVHFRQPGLWERYRGLVTGVLVAGALQAALIVVLLVERRRRMGAQRLQLAVLDSLPGAVAILDNHGVVLRANPVPAGLQVLEGWTAEALFAPGIAYLEHFREAARTGNPDMAPVAALLLDVLRGHAHEGVVEFRGFAEDTWFELRARHLELPEGGAVVSLVDVTPRRRAELEARRARDERAHLERVAAVGELGVSIAHELNQPLAAILTNAEMAQRLLTRSPTDLPLLREMLQDIVSDNKRAGEVIRHMRALLKKGEVCFGEYDLNELIQRVMRLVSNDAQLRGATLTLHLAESPLPVRADGVQLQQVVLNLVMNALDAVGACPPGERRIWVRTRPLEDRAELVVEDTGPGLSDEVLARLFEPFFTTKAKGLGMGLSISRSLLEVHQGRLQAERGPGRGALFRCTLPLVPERHATVEPLAG
ncbi:MAG TPA: ATP-binding protein [Archangium sp.]|uniref:sensor histidine kinase n=1 Tax=Archangium sp. TaxID=1872627 RepID=UPI002E367597|nr:ATP-binding protein [Archangium sp.]HEX5744749.1 ATP-binding protein [Archangium sp.]